MEFRRRPGPCSCAHSSHPRTAAEPTVRTPRSGYRPAPMGPLTGFRVLELPNIGPMQFAGMALADLGAEVLRLDRATAVAAGSGTMPAQPYASLDRNRCSA